MSDSDIIPRCSPIPYPPCSICGEFPIQDGLCFICLKDQMYFETTSIIDLDLKYFDSRESDGNRVLDDLLFKLN